MQEFLNGLGMTQGELTTIIVIGIAALVGLGLLRTMVKLTAALFRLGCAVIVIILIVSFIVTISN